MMNLEEFVDKEIEKLEKLARKEHQPKNYYTPKNLLETKKIDPV